MTTRDGGFSVAVFGATGAVGAEILRLLEERQFPVSRLRVFATADTAGEPVEFRGEEIIVSEATGEQLPGTALAFLAVPANAAVQWFELLSALGIFTIDLSGAGANRRGAELLVPEINGEEISATSRLAVSPAGPVPALAMAVDALRDIASPKRVYVTLFIPASYSGRNGMEELGEQTIALLNHKEVPLMLFPQRLAFNLIPDVGGIGGEGQSSELERRVAFELSKVLGEEELDVTVHAVRVPLFSGMAASVTVELEQPTTPEAIRAAIVQADGLVLIDDPQKESYPLPGNVSEQDAVFVGRLRLHPTDGSRVSMWLAFDNLRKGSALNAVQIAEAAVRVGALGRPGALAERLH